MIGCRMIFWLLSAGLCHVVGFQQRSLSDNGTNFVGANHELQHVYQLTTSSTFNKDIQPFLTQHRINWRFNPSRVPHFGGLWEAGVKSAKLLLRKLLKDHALTFEEYNTVLCEVESVLNSRPLVALYTLPEDGA